MTTTKHTTTAADVQIVARNLTATVTHAIASDDHATVCGRAIGETWTGEYDAGLGWGLPTCKRCMAAVQSAHDAIVAAATYRIGQRVGIVTGSLSLNGPTVTAYGTVVNVAEFWTGVTEFLVREDDGTSSYFREYLLRPLTARRTREAAMASHPAGKGRAVHIGGMYPHNVPVGARLSDETRETMARLGDLLSPNLWNV